MKKAEIILMATVISVMLFMAGSKAPAAFGDYGKIVPRSDVTQAFDSYRIDPNLNYYFSGSDVWPDAIIGVNKDYTLDSTFWKKIEATPGVLKNLVSGMKTRPDKASDPDGYAVLDDKGKQIGVWYSYFGVMTYVKMESERTVDIRTPINPYRPELLTP
jgi:hypothetical protein